MTTRLLLIGLLLGACTGATPGAPTPPPATEGQVDADTTYACPMHPEVTSTDPDATCTKCGMNLLKREEHVHGSMPHEDHDH